MTILYYDDSKSKKELYDIVKRIGAVTQDKVVALPKNFDVLLNCSLDHLLSIKGIIDATISLKMKEQAEN